jgi:transposase-like protein
VRSTDGKELPLPHYQHFSDEDPLDQATLNKVLSGIATRSYKRTLDRMEDSVEAHGVSKSAVSRRFIAATQKQLNEWLNRSLDGMDIVVLMVDGIEVEDHTIVVALGIDTSGKKHILGAREGTTENEAVCSELLSNLVDRGLPTDCYILVVIDGSKAIRKAVRKVFGKNAVIQRCQLHKIRNVLDHLPEAKKSATKKVMTTAYLQEDSESARRMLLNLADKLESNHPGAASSLREGLDETLTVLRLSISDAEFDTLNWPHFGAK